MPGDVVVTEVDRLTQELAEARAKYAVEHSAYCSLSVSHDDLIIQVSELITAGRKLKEEISNLRARLEASEQLLLDNRCPSCTARNRPISGESR